MLSFQMRASKPAAGNRFYITQSKGGDSLCIQGSPTDSACNVLSNCVGYACGRFNEIIGSMKYPALNCNAENFIERAQSLGLTITQKPSLGAIMVWQKGMLASSDGAGHVEVVERIDSDTQVYTSASNYAGAAFYNVTRTKSGGEWALPASWGTYKFRGFIKNPGVIDNVVAAQLTGLDVSAHQGVIDWPKVKASGQKVVMIRAGWAGYDGHISDGVDKYFAANMKGAIAAGLDVGVYVYSYCKTPAAAKIAAQDVLAMIAPYRLTMPVAFDFEDSALYAGYTKAANTEICKAFLTAIQSAGYYPLLYTYTNFANSYLNMAELSGYDLWQADYRGYMGAVGSFTGTKGGWQYSSSGAVSGISGRVDMNYFYKDYPAIIGGGGTATEKGVQKMKVVDIYAQITSEQTGGKRFNVQTFRTPDVNDIAGDYLPDGRYWCNETGVKLAGLDGYEGAQIMVDGRAVYVAIIAGASEYSDMTMAEAYSRFVDGANGGYTAAEVQAVRAQLAATEASLAQVQAELDKAQKKISGAQAALS